MEDLRDASFVLGIEIFRERSQGTLRLSQRSYINKIFKRFGIQDCKLGDRDKFSLNKCPKGNIKVQRCKKFPMYLLYMESNLCSSLYVARYNVHC